MTEEDSGEFLENYKGNAPCGHCRRDAKCVFVGWFASEASKL